jgi:hypothetical protein
MMSSLFFRRPRRGSNPQPTDSKSGTLSIELRGRASNYNRKSLHILASGTSISDMLNLKPDLRGLSSEAFFYLLVCRRCDRGPKTAYFGITCYAAFYDTFACLHFINAALDVR